MSDMMTPSVKSVAEFLCAVANFTEVVPHLFERPLRNHGLKILYTIADGLAQSAIVQQNGKGKRLMFLPIRLT